MTRFRWLSGTVVMTFALTGGVAWAQGESATPAGPQPYKAASPPAKVDAPAALAGIRIDREAGHVDLVGRVVLREGEWLEMLACTPGTREHESILTVEARPRDIHLSLILLGLEPGSPLRWERRDDETFVVHPPTGPKLAITLIYEQDGQTKTVDANQWVINQETKKVMEGNIWLFTGSRLETFDDKQIYMADPNGTVISLVNFGDDVLARDTKVTRDDDEQAWNCNTELIPDVGTAVTIRLKPIEAVKPAAGEAEPSPQAQ